MMCKKIVIAAAMLSAWLFAGVSMAATAPVSCQFSLTGSACLLTGQAQGGNNLTGNQRDPFLNSEVGLDYSFIGEYENEAFWTHNDSSTSIILNGDFDEYAELALGIKQGPYWSVFLVDLSLNAYDFSESDISNIKVYGISGNGGGGSIVDVSEVPLPAAVWLFGSVLMGGIAMRRRSQKMNAQAVAA